MRCLLSIISWLSLFSHCVSLSLAHTSGWVCGAMLILLIKVNICFYEGWGLNWFHWIQNKESFQVTEWMLVFVRSAFHFSLPSGSLDWCLMRFICWIYNIHNLFSVKQKSQTLGWRWCSLCQYHNHCWTLCTWPEASRILRSKTFLVSDWFALGVQTAPPSMKIFHCVQCLDCGPLGQ